MDERDRVYAISVFTAVCWVSVTGFQYYLAKKKEREKQK